MGDTSKIATLPVCSLSSPGCETVVALVSVNEAVGHDHVDERIFPNKGGMWTTPKGDEKVVCHVAIGVNTLNLERMFSIG